MELGIGPLVTASMIMQLLSGTKIISIDQNDKEERKKFKTAERCKLHIPEARNIKPYYSASTIKHDVLTYRLRTHYYIR